MLDKQRGIAYRKMLAGLRFHADDDISHIQFGLQRGSIKDLRIAFQKLTTWIKRDFGIRIDYCRVEVWENTESTKGDDRTRIHCHMLWNAPYIKQALIVEKFQTYIGENANVHIKLVDDHKKASRYLLQYLGYKQSTCYFSYSRGWLPKGYNDHFKAVKDDFNQYVPVGIRKPLDDALKVESLMQQSSDEWRKAVLIDLMNTWIDEQKGNDSDKVSDEPKQLYIADPILEKLRYEQPVNRPVLSLRHSDHFKELKDRLVWSGIPVSLFWQVYARG